MAKICLRCYISGHVQGVFYRAHTQEQALKLGLTGWVKNLADGRVEALVCGEEDTVVELVNWMQSGPPRATVSTVETKLELWQEFENFAII